MDCSFKNSDVFSLNESMESISDSIKPVSEDELMSNSSISDDESTKNQFISHDELVTDQSFERELWNINDFELGKRLGKGRFGNVMLARRKDNRLVCALKILFKKQLMGCKIDYQNEIEIHSSLQHPNILRFYNSFDDDDRVYLVLEYAKQGDLYSKLKQEKHFTEALASKYIHDITIGIQYLHNEHIIHMDIKPENLLLTEQNIVKIGDFGWSVRFMDINDKKSRVCGTPYYLAPEMLLNHSYDWRISIWQIGILMYEFLFGKPPYDDKHDDKIYDKIINDEPHYPFIITDIAHNLITNLLQKDPDKRLSIEQILENEWLKF